MAVPKELLSVLVCPKCLGPIRSASDGKGILCTRCQVQYPVRDGIPVMVSEEAVTAGQAAAEEELSKASPKQTVTIYVVEGKNKGEE